MDRFLTMISVCLVLGVVSLPGMFEAKTCWDSKWYNNSSPTNRSEYEKVPKATLDKICSTGPVQFAQCKDNRGEPFSGHKIDKNNEYDAYCNTSGLVCNPFINSTKSCPDFSIQFGCICPTSTVSPPSSRVNPSTSGPIKVSSSKPSSKPSSRPVNLGSSTIGTGSSNSSLQKGDNNGGIKTGGCIDLLVMMISLAMMMMIM